MPFFLFRTSKNSMYDKRFPSVNCRPFTEFKNWYKWNFCIIFYKTETFQLPTGIYKINLIKYHISFIKVKAFRFSVRFWCEGNNGQMYDRIWKYSHTIWFGCKTVLRRTKKLLNFLRVYSSFLIRILSIGKTWDIQIGWFMYSMLVFRITDGYLIKYSGKVLFGYNLVDYYFGSKKLILILQSFMDINIFFFVCSNLNE